MQPQTSRPLAKPGFSHRHPVLVSVTAGLGLALLLLVLLFDWNWLRPPLERYVSQKTQRTFTISDLHVRLGWTPTIRMRDVYFGNAQWGESEYMARVKELSFSVSLRDLPEKILVPHVALTEPDLVFERTKEQRKNWTLQEPSEDTSPSRLRISTLSVDKGRLRYTDEAEPLAIDVTASTFAPDALTATNNAKTPSTPASKNVRDESAGGRYATRYSFTGKYHGGPFSGQAWSGPVLSFQESGQPFPLKGDLTAGRTRLWVEGSVADAVKLSVIDAHIKVQGQSLSDVYPFLRLPLPTSPPYSLEGHLLLQGQRYAIDDLRGKIGASDVRGRASYVKQEPRPLLNADLRSERLRMEDLGPLVGRQASSAKKVASAEATQKTQPVASNRVLPTGAFDASRLKEMDANVTLVARRLDGVGAWPLEGLRASLRLQDAVMQLDPLEVGFAGGKIIGDIQLDARTARIKTRSNIDFRSIHLDQLLPADSKIAQGAGLVGARIALTGVGNSVADAAATANGNVSAAISNGRVSNLLDAASGLNGGKVLTLLLGGDKSIAVNCGGLSFDIENGRGRSKLFVVDTEQTQILGDGTFDLGQERMDLTLTPKPKRVGLLSLRTPVRLHGTFKNPDYTLEKGPLLARAGGAVALLAVAPLAALLPLIETGPGENTNCSLLQSNTTVKAAEKQATKPAP